MVFRRKIIPRLFQDNISARRKIRARYGSAQKINLLAQVVQAPFRHILSDPERFNQLIPGNAFITGFQEQQKYLHAFAFYIDVKPDFPAEIIQGIAAQKPGIKACIRPFFHEFPPFSAKSVN